MRRYGESHEKAVQNTIEEYRRAAGYDRIYDDRRADMIFIYYYSPDHYDQRTICRIALQDRRIDCNQSKASAADYYAKHLESAAKLEEIAPQIDTIRARLEELNRMKKTIVGGIPYELRDIYGIH